MVPSLATALLLACCLSASALAQPFPYQTLPQGWDPETRERFWFTSQGSRLVPYGWFLHLEQASGEPFRSDAHMEALRYVPVPPGPGNADGLPIGFARDQREGEDWLGLTCAACHTSRIDHEGAKWLVEGGPALADFGRFFAELVAALEETAEDDARFDRFAGHVLGGSPGGFAKWRLRRDLRARAEELALRATINSPPPESPSGYPGFARLDAFGQIYNQVSVVLLDEPDNAHAADGPVSYPALWGAPLADNVQWNGVAPNTPIVGHVLRNVGEVVGVFAQVELSEPPKWKFWQDGYASSVDFDGLGELEAMLWELRAPRWPPALPAPDPALVAEGREVYDTACKGCHVRVDEGTRYRTHLEDVDAIGTDPNMVEHGAGWKCKTGRLAGERKFGLNLFERFGDEALCHDLTVHAVVGLVRRRPFEAIAAALRGWKGGGVAPSALAGPRPQLLDSLLEQALRSRDAPPRKYRARPLHGVWATAPYLHNGSVPNLWELLRPAERSPRFCVGNRTFDPVKVGLRTDCEPGTTEVDTGISGNRNTGHERPGQLSEEERNALLEFLKTL